MPLIKSKSKGAFKTNVSTLMGEIGKSPHVQSRAQALAIAFSTKRRARAEGGASTTPPPLEPQAPAGLDTAKLQRMMLMQRQIMQGRPAKFSGRGDVQTDSLHDVTAPVSAGRMNPKGWEAFLEQAPESQNIEDRRGVLDISQKRYPDSTPISMVREPTTHLDEMRAKFSGPMHQYANRAREGGSPSLELLAKIAASMGGMAEGGRTPTQEELIAAASASQLSPHLSRVIDTMKPEKPPPIKKAQGGYTNLSPPWYARHAMKGLGLSSTKGFLNSAVPGRTDRLNLDVAPGSYVVPADIVSALGQGNSMAGAKMLKKMFGAPRMASGGKVSVTGSPIAQDTQMFTAGGMNLNKYGGGRFRRPGIKGLRREQYEMAEGGETPQENVPIVAAGGELILDPAEVAVAGRGDAEAGYNVLDDFVKRVRKEHIETLRNLKPPKKD